MEVKTLDVSFNVSLENIPDLWEQNDVLLFIIDMDDYGTLNADHLDEKEKQYLEGLKTPNFKKRFIVSRMALKYICRVLLDKEFISDILLYKDNYGKLHLSGNNKINICLSYTGNVILLAVSKIKVGIDVEKKRCLPFNSNSGYMQAKGTCENKEVTNLDFLITWTVKEAYCKFSNKSILSYLRKTLDTGRICYCSYLINNMYILAVVTDYDQYKININSLQKIACT